MSKNKKKGLSVKASKKRVSKKKLKTLKLVKVLGSFLKKPSLISFLIALLFIGQYYLDNKSSEKGAAVKEFSNGAVRVIDGDSIVLGKLKIRMQGIDAPELKQECLDKKSKLEYKCGELSKNYLIKLIAGQSVQCSNEGEDKYNRQLSYCYIGKLNLNREMVRTGNAVAYSKYDKSFIKEEMEAKLNKIGIWGSEFANPENWRKNKKSLRK